MESECPLLPDLSATVFEFLHGEDIREALRSGWFGITRTQWDNVMKRVRTKIYYHHYYASLFTHSSMLSLDNTSRVIRWASTPTLNGIEYDAETGGFTIETPGFYQCHLSASATPAATTKARSAFDNTALFFSVGEEQYGVDMIIGGSGHLATTVLIPLKVNDVIFPCVSSTTDPHVVGTSCSILLVSLSRH